LTSLKTKADYVRACRVVKRVIDEWDPYSLLAQGAPRDEFEAEVAAIARLIPTMHSRDAAAQAVSGVFSAAFEAKYFGLEACRRVGARLFDALRSDGLLPE
jgi:hypothetical protein